MKNLKSEILFIQQLGFSAFLSLPPYLLLYYALMIGSQDIAPFSTLYLLAFPCICLLFCGTFIQIFHNLLNFLGTQNTKISTFFMYEKSSNKKCAKKCLLVLMVGQVEGQTLERRPHHRQLQFDNEYENKSYCPSFCLVNIVIRPYECSISCF